MAAQKSYREVESVTLKWIIIDDKTSDLKKMAKELRDLKVESNNILGFKVESQGKFKVPAIDVNGKSILLNFAKFSETPTFDYSGSTYSFDENNELKCEDEDNPKSLYKNVLYQMDEGGNKAINFIFLIDLDFGNKSFCGFDILTLLRKTLKPTNYQVRFITNVPRKSIKKFIDEEYGDNFAILGDNKHLSFISKDSTIRKLPIITKDYYEQFTSTFIEKDQKTIYNVYKSNRKDKVVCLSDNPINITIGERKYEDIIQIKNLNKLENEIKNSKPTIVVVNLDLYGNEPLKGIWTVENISKNMSKSGIEGFSVYFVTFKTKEEREKDETWKAISRSHWKTFLHLIDEDSHLKVDVAKINSPIYWKFKISISPYRQFIHDLKNALNLECKDKSDELNKIKEEIKAYHTLTEDPDVKKLLDTLDIKGKNLSIDDIEEPIEKILWVVVGVDKESVDKTIEKLNKEAEDLKKCKYLNDKDDFKALVVKNTVEEFKEQIENLSKSENTVFLFDDVMPCYENNASETIKYTKALEIIKDKFDGKNFTYRVLECTTWNLIEMSDNSVIIDGNTKKGFKSNHKCLDSFVYSWPKKEGAFFTIDRLYFMREDLKIPKSFARNPAFDKLKNLMRNGSIIPKDFVNLRDILYKNEPAKWQTIQWGSNYRCDETCNQEILINRLYILDFVCEEFIFMPCDRNCLPVVLAKFKEFILTQIGKKSKLTVRNFLHLQYAFDIWQENKEGKNQGNENEIFVKISPDSLFNYEKEYLLEKYKEKYSLVKYEKKNFSEESRIKTRLERINAWLTDGLVKMDK